MSNELSHPDLYREARRLCRVVGDEMPSCGFVAFPRQRYGCEKCGAAGDALSDVRTELRVGTLASYATVHMHQAKTIAAPFVIGEIALDAGPTVRATMVEADDAAMQIGARVDGRLHPAPAPAGARRAEARTALRVDRSAGMTKPLSAFRPAYVVGIGLHRYQR